MSPTKLAATVVAATAAFAVGAAISTVAYVVVLGHILWEGELD